MSKRKKIVYWKSDLVSLSTQKTKDKGGNEKILGKGILSVPV